MSSSLLLGDSVVCPAEPLAGTGRAGAACGPNHRAESPPRAVKARLPGGARCYSPVSQSSITASVTAQCHSQPDVTAQCHSQPSVAARQCAGPCKECHYLFWGAMVQITATTPKEALTVQKHESLFACFALLFLPGLCGLYLHK